ncbi:hypothetical protein PGQ11_010653 [Apiospora arundinis]|uniref:Zn(2)-C6 fungal-type domain-containing protein n=1 Tax=Apiospora arundinis TaxID=335852 RepID=A0ABR2IA95_9PEZI
MDTDLRKRLGLAGEECGRVQHQTDMIFTPDPVIDAHRQEILNDVAANAVEPDALPVKSQGNCDHESLPLRPVGSRFAGHLRNIAHLPVTAPSVTDNGSVHSTVLRDPSPPILDDPSFHDFLESIPESDPTTLQSLLSQEALNENILPKQNSFFSTTGITELGSNAESASPANEDVAGRINVIKTGSIVRPPPTASNHSISLHRTHLLSNGKRKLPSLEEMRNDNYILRLYGATTGRRSKRVKLKGRQCARCRLKNLKCSEHFPCTSCVEHWDKATNWAKERKMVVWSHCFDARLEDLNVLIDLTHSLMFARLHPPKRSEFEMNRYGDSFKHMCLIKELVQGFGVDPRLREQLESQCRGPIAASRLSERKSPGPPLWSLLNDIQRQHSNETWILDPSLYHPRSSPSSRSSIRLSEIVIILFLHSEYLYQHTNLSVYEIYSLCMCYSHLFFEQILAHLKSGKIHTMPKDSPAATELAIDLGTLFLLISYGPAHLRSMCRPVSTDDSWPTPGCSEGTMTRSPENPEATNKITSYIISELDRWLGPEGTGRFQDRQLPFKARTLPDRWAFLQDYLSHWVDKVGLCSTNTPSVVSSLVLAYRLCRMDLVDTRSNRGVHHRLMNHRPTPPLRPRIPENLHYLSTLCRQMQDQWTPQKANEISHGYLADKKVVVWHLIALWDLNSRPKQEEEEEESTTDKQDLTRLPDMFPPAVRMQATSAQALESQLRMMHRLCTESSEEMDVIKQQWQAISHDIKLPTPVEQEWLKAYQRVRQITLESFLKRSWT